MRIERYIRLLILQHLHKSIQLRQFGLHHRVKVSLCCNFFIVIGALNSPIVMGHKNFVECRIVFITEINVGNIDFFLTN